MPGDSVEEIEAISLVSVRRKSAGPLDPNAMNDARKFSMFSMPLADAMTTQRAIRRIKPDPVDDELILELIELALKGPTAQDGQGWEFVVVKDLATKAAFARQARRMWRLYSPIANRRYRHDAKKRRMYQAVQWSVDHFEEIPVYIVACFRGSRFGYPPVIGSSTYGSIFPAVQNLLLAARAAGLGANLVTLPLWSNFIARRILGLPFGLTPAAMIPIGWPIGRYGPTTRRPVGEVVSLDRYDNRPWRERS
jgi:nitroreductase